MKALTIEEAQQMYCPFLQDKQSSTRCKTEGCMAWEWKVWRTKQNTEAFNSGMSGEKHTPDKGVCGLLKGDK